MKSLQQIPISLENTVFKARIHYWVCLLLVIATLTVYWQVRNHEFLDYDDDLYVVENHFIRGGLNKKSVVWTLTAIVAANWHPITLLSHLLDVQLFGMNSGAHHFTNLLFHVVNTVVLFLVLRKLTGALWKSAFVAALFALHPLHVETVAQVACRKDVLSTFFFLLVLLSYGRYVRRPTVFRYLSVFLFFVIGLMAKPMLVTLPFVLLLMDYWPLERFQMTETGVWKRSFWGLIKEKIPLFILTIALSYVTFLVQKKSGAVGTLVEYSFAIRGANALVSYSRYIFKMIWPTHMAFFYPHPGLWPLWQVAGAFLLLAGITIIIIKPSKKRHYLIVGWLWYIGTLIPVIGLIQVGSQAMADRYTYIPLVGLFIMIVWGAADLLKKWRYGEIGLAAAGLVILSSLITISLKQVGYWQNSIKLFSHAIAVTSNNVAAYNNLGIALEREGRYAQAIRQYKKILEIKPDQADVHNNLGNALLSMGKISEAEKHLYTAVRLNPNHAKAHNNLGNALMGQGKPTQAIQHYSKALEIYPDYKEAHYNLGNAFLSENKFQGAVNHYFMALQIDPFYVAAQNNLAVTLVKQGKIIDAIRFFSEALQKKPGNPVLKNNLNYILGEKLRIEKAIEEQKVLIKNNPQDPKRHYILGNLYRSVGALDAAKRHYEMAITPEFSESINNLAMIFAVEGKYDRARTLFKQRIALQPDAPEAYYFIAGTYSRQGKTKEAIEWLIKAIEKGFNDWELIKQDKNLNNIKNSSYYQNLIKNR